ncbi:hypothetical protein Dimus_007938 [Dionaea muscipula]
MSGSSRTPSPAHSTMSTSTTTTANTTTTTTTAAVQGTNTTGSSISLSSATNNPALSLDDFNFPSHLISIQDRKDEALSVLKSELMAALHKEVKSLDDDNWMFEGPRSRINLISRPGGSIAMKNSQLSIHCSFSMPK